MCANVLEKEVASRKRPGEIVREYIESRFLRSPGSDVVKLPAIHAFARDLNVSVSTVRSVFRALAQEGKIVSTPGRGTFLRRETGEPHAGRQLCLGINLSNLKLSSTEWWGNSVFNGAAGEALTQHAMITALGATGGVNGNEAAVRASIERVDGVLLLPSRPREHRLLELCKEQGKPVVSVVPEFLYSTANFVTVDAFSFCLNLAQAWRAAGRRRVAVFLSNPVLDGAAGAHVFSAFQLVFADLAEAVVTPVVVTEGDVEESGYLAASRYLKECRQRPDAIYCMGDYIAEGVLRAFGEMGVAVPDEVSLAGGVGLEGVRIRTPELVTQLQPMRMIGEEAVKMLLWRIANGNASLPGVYLPSALGRGTTLTSAEMEFFRQYAASRQELIPLPEEGAGA